MKKKQFSIFKLAPFLSKMSKKYILIVATFCVASIFFVFKCIDGQEPVNNYEKLTIEQLYKKYIELSEAGKEIDSIKIYKEVYLEKCKNAGISTISKQFSLHPQDEMIKSLVKSEIIEKFNKHDFDSLLYIAPYFKDTIFQEYIVNNLEAKAFGLGHIARAKVYKLNLDDSYDEVVDIDIDDIETIQLDVCRKMVDCYKGTDKEDDVINNLVSRIENDIRISRNKIPANIDRVIEEEHLIDSIDTYMANFYEDMFEGVLDINNTINVVARGKDGQRDKYNEIWDKNVKAKVLNNIYTKALSDAFKLHKNDICAILKEINSNATYTNPTILNIKFLPNDSIRINTVEANDKRGAADIILFITDLALCKKIGLKSSWIIDGITGIGKDLVFDDPKDYFLVAQRYDILNTLTKENDKYFSIITKQDEQVINTIKSSL